MKKIKFKVLCIIDNLLHLNEKMLDKIRIKIGTVICNMYMEDYKKIVYSDFWENSNLKESDFE